MTDLRLVLAGLAEADLFGQVVKDVFDGPIDPELLDTFLGDPRHHMILACLGGDVVGMISGVHHIHPDKAPQMWINELGVATPFRRKGIARALVGAFCDHARTLGCTEAWLVADPTEEAMGFYRSLGVAQTGENLAMFTFDLSAP